MEEETYCGQHRFNCFSALVWTDVLGIIMILNIICCCPSHERVTYNQCDIAVHPCLYSSNSEFIIGESGFQGDGSHTFTNKIKDRIFP